MGNPVTVAELKKLFLNNSTNHNTSNNCILKPSLKETNHQSKQSVKFKFESEIASKSHFNRNVGPCKSQTQHENHDQSEIKGLCQRSNGFKSISKKLENMDLQNKRAIQKRKENNSHAPKSNIIKFEDHRAISLSNTLINGIQKPIAYKIDLSEILRSSEKINENHLTNLQQLDGSYENQFTDDKVPSLTTSEDSGFVPDNSSSSCKESGSEISNQDSIIDRWKDRPNKGGEKILEGVIVNTGSHNCVAFERKAYKTDGWGNYDRISTFVSNPSHCLDSYDYDSRNYEILNRNASESHSGHYRKKTPANKRRVESIKRYSVHQHRQHNKHRRSITRISVGSEDTENTVYFSEPELDYDDDDVVEDHLNNFPGNPYRTRSQDFETQPHFYVSTYGGRKEDTNLMETNFERFQADKVDKNLIKKAETKRRHTCEVDVRWNQEFGASVGNKKFEFGSQNNLNGRIIKQPLKRTLSDVSFTIDLSDVIKQNDNYRVSLVASPIDDQIFDYNFPQPNRHDKSVQTQDISMNPCKSETFGHKVLQPYKPEQQLQEQKILKQEIIPFEIQHKDQTQQHDTKPVLQQQQRQIQQVHQTDQQQQMKGQQNISKHQQQEKKESQQHQEAKPRRKESLLKKIFNSSFMMAKQGFRDKWTRRRSNVGGEGSEKKQNKTKDANEICFSGRQVNKFNSKTLTPRNAKTFLPQAGCVQSSDVTSSDSLFDDVDGRWMDGQEDDGSFSRYQMWDFGEKLNKKPTISKQNLAADASQENIEWIKSIDILSLLKDSHKDSISETVEILDDELNKICQTPTVSLNENRLNIITFEDFQNDKKQRIRKSILIDMQANNCRRELLSNIIKNLKTQRADVNEEFGNINLLGKNHMEILAKLITMSEMNKLSNINENL